MILLYVLLGLALAFMVGVYLWHARPPGPPPIPIPAPEPEPSPGPQPAPGPGPEPIPGPIEPPEPPEAPEPSPAPTPPPESGPVYVNGWRIVGPPPAIETARVTRVYDNNIWIDFEIVVRPVAGELANNRHRLYAVPPGKHPDSYMNPFKEDIHVNNLFVVDRVMGQPDGIDLYVRAEEPSAIGKKASPWAFAAIRL